MKNVGVERAFVVHGMDGLDEVTITTKTKVSELKDKKVKSFYVEPKNFGINVAAINDIKGGSVEENVKIIKDVLKGKIGPKYDIVVLNAAFSLVVGDIVKDVKEGVKMADKTIQSGKAMEKLDRLIEFTNN